MIEAERFEDMSPRGRLRVTQQDDGDIIVTVIEDPDGMFGGAMCSVEFCAIGSGGGASPKTLSALRQLMFAIGEDNTDGIHSHRRGKRGLGSSAEDKATGEQK